MHSKVCTTALILLTENLAPALITEERIFNSSYQVSYFNSMSALWRRAQVTNESKVILIHENESIYRALENLLNRDHKVIRLREELNKNNIMLRPITKERMWDLTNTIKASDRPHKKSISVNWPNVTLQREATRGML